MIGESIYLRDRAAFTGGSPQAVYEELWQQGRKNRLRTRAILAGCALLLGGYFASPLFGVIVAVAVAAGDALGHWWRYTSVSVWRKGLRGERRMGRLLGHTLERRGYRVLPARTVPGHGVADQILIGPGGVWLINNDAWHPDSEFSAHGGHVYLDGRTPSKMIKDLTGAAAKVSELLSARLGMDVPVAPLMAVHGGRLPKRRISADGITLLTPLKLLRWPGEHPTADYTEQQLEDILRTAIRVLPISGRTMPLAV